MSGEPALEVGQGLGIKPAAIRIHELAHERKDGDVRFSDIIAEQLIMLSKARIELGEELSAFGALFQFCLLYTSDAADD